MTKFALFLIAKGIAFTTGSGLLDNFWILATLIVDYLRAIFAESDNAPNGDYRKLSGDEFGKSENNIKMRTAKNLLSSALVYGAGYLFNYLSWI